MLENFNSLNELIKDFIKQEKRERADKKVRDQFWSDIANALDGGGGLKDMAFKAGVAVLKGTARNLINDHREKVGDLE